MKKSIPIIWERESGAFILGNGREWEFPLTPAVTTLIFFLDMMSIIGQSVRAGNSKALQYCEISLCFTDIAWMFH